MTNPQFDVIIVGAGPAGLSAALILGRCRRRVLVCDSGKPRNAASRGLHGYLTRDGVEPVEFLKIGREQILPYETVKLVQVEVTKARRSGDMFELTLIDGQVVSSRKLLLATGVVDELPEIEGLRELYGRGVFHCPYCDGWEMRDQPLAVYGQGDTGSGLAKELLLWSRDVVLCTNAGELPAKESLEELDHHGIQVRQEKIERLEGRDGLLERIVFENGQSIERRGLFFSTGQHQHSDLAKQLGCGYTEDGCVATGEYEATDVPGLYVAGDASRFVQMVIVAAAEGAQAAVAINKELMKEDLNAGYTH